MYRDPIVTRHPQSHHCSINQPSYAIRRSVQNRNAFHGVSANGRDHGVALIDCPFVIARYATPVHRMVRTISELILHKRDRHGVNVAARTNEWSVLSCSERSIRRSVACCAGSPRNDNVRQPAHARATSETRYPQSHNHSINQSSYDIRRSVQNRDACHGVRANGQDHVDPAFDVVMAYLRTTGSAVHPLVRRAICGCGFARNPLKPPLGYQVSSSWCCNLPIPIPFPQRNRRPNADSEYHQSDGQCDHRDP